MEYLICLLIGLNIGIYVVLSRKLRYLEEKVQWCKDDLESDKKVRVFREANLLKDIERLKDESTKTYVYKTQKEDAGYVEVGRKVSNVLGLNESK